MQDNELDRHYDYMEWCYNGYESMVNGSVDQFKAMTGAESYYVLHLDAYAGNEAKIMDQIKEGAKRLYENIIATLKRVREYFFGEGEKAAETAAEAAESSLNAMDGLRGDAPIPENHPARDPETYIKQLEGGTEFQEVMKENSNLTGAIDRVRKTLDKVKNAATVGNLRAVLKEAKSELDKGVRAVGDSLRKELSDAEKAAGKLKSPKLPKEGDSPEVASAVKQENTEATQEAKDATMHTRIIGGVRNKFVGVYNTISANIKKVNDNPPKSDFKG